MNTCNTATLCGHCDSSVQHWNTVTAACNTATLCRHCDSSVKHWNTVWTLWQQRATLQHYVDTVTAACHTATLYGHRDRGGQHWRKLSQLCLLSVGLSAPTYNFLHCIAWIYGLQNYRCILIVIEHSYPEWPHRQGGCLACCGCTFGFRAEVALIYTMHEALRGYCPWGWGVRPVNWIYRLWRHCP